MTCNFDCWFVLDGGGLAVLLRFAVYVVGIVACDLRVAASVCLCVTAVSGAARF